MENAVAHFPWRQLGELLVGEDLLTEDELEQALHEQARTGRLLGQIVVSNGYVSAFSLARVLSQQHGVELRRTGAEPPPAVQDQTSAETPWRPLGKLLVERSFLSEAQLERALAAQRDEGGRLGEVLVSRGFLSGAELAQALAEQQGVELEPPDESELETVVRRSAPAEPVYKVFEVIFEPGYQRRTPLYENSNFLEAADFAFEFVEEHEPAALEIHRTDGAADETVWNYSASRAAAIGAARKNLAETFGFDPTRWGTNRRN